MRKKSSVHKDHSTVSSRTISQIDGLGVIIAMCPEAREKRCFPKVGDWANVIRKRSLVPGLTSSFGLVLFPVQRRLQSLSD
jgi:hypothetical protein